MVLLDGRRWLRVLLIKIYCSHGRKVSLLPTVLLVVVTVLDLVGFYCYIDGHTWQMVKCPAGVRYLVSWLN